MSDVAVELCECDWCSRYCPCVEHERARQMRLGERLRALGFGQDGDGQATS